MGSNKFISRGNCHFAYWLKAATPTPCSYRTLAVDFLFVILAIFQCSAVAEESVAQEGSTQYMRVSLINLISTPERFDGKQISVVGVVRAIEHVTEICLSEKVPSDKECVWLQFDNNNHLWVETFLRIKKETKSSLVEVKGKFTTNYPTYFYDDETSTAIEEITSVRSVSWHKD